MIPVADIAEISLGSAALIMATIIALIAFITTANDVNGVTVNGIYPQRYKKDTNRQACFSGTIQSHLSGRPLLEEIFADVNNLTKSRKKIKRYMKPMLNMAIP